MLLFTVFAVSDNAEMLSFTGSEASENTEMLLLNALRCSV